MKLGIKVLESGKTEELKSLVGIRGDTEYIGVGDEAGGVEKDEFRWIKGYEMLLKGRAAPCEVNNLIPTMQTSPQALLDCGCRSECGCRSDCGCRNDCGCRKDCGCRSTAERA